MTPTWRIWRALDVPPSDHPLYRFSQRDPRPAARSGALWPWLALLALTILALALTGQLLALVYGLLGLVLGAPIAFFILGGSLLGAWISVRTAVRVWRWRQSADSLIHTTPLGMMGAAWLIALSQANAHQRRHYAWRYGRWLGGAVVLAVLFIQSSATLDPNFEAQRSTLLSDSLWYLSLTLALILDQAYSPVQGLLIGLLSASRPRPLLGMPLTALTAFLTWQLVVTLYMGMSLAFGTADLARDLVAEGSASLMLRSAAVVLAYVLWREAQTACLLWFFHRRYRGL